MRTVTLASETDFAGWRAAARTLILDEVPPEDVTWSVRDAPSLFAALEDASDHGVESPPASKASPFKVPRVFVERCAMAILHRDADRFAFLHRLLWRIRREPALIEIAIDRDVARLDGMVKAVRRDLHKTKAYVRFREAAVPASAGTVPRPSQIERALRDGDHFNVLEPWFVAWFEPSHRIVEAVAPFFVRRFATMNWAILTPDRCAFWDGESLRFGPGARRGDAPGDDAVEDLWRSYYANIFNPARLKLATMQGQMPKKYWKNLPEAELIAPLAAAARHRTQTMIDAEARPAPSRTERVMRAAGHAPAAAATKAEEDPDIEPRPARDGGGVRVRVN